MTVVLAILIVLAVVLFLLVAALRTAVFEEFWRRLGGDE